MTQQRGRITAGTGARYAYLRSDGTSYIVAGSAVAGIASYAYQLIGGRTLGAHDFAPVSVLLTVHFLTLIVLLLPIEQLMVRRLTLDQTVGSLPRQAYWLGGLTVAGSTLFAWLGVDAYLNGDGRFIAFTAVTVAGHFVFSVARGHLAGRRRFRAYGLASGWASILRLVVALGITLVHPSASGFAVGLIVGPAIVMAWRPFRATGGDRPGLEPTHRETMSDRGLLAGLVLASAASQALLLGGPILVGLLGGAPTEISIAFAAFTLGRAPLTFGYNLLARVLPPFTVMAARGERQELRAWARGMAWAACGLSAVAAVLGWVAGPWVVEVAFGAGFVPGRATATTVAMGVILAGAGLFVGQILVARNQTFRLGAAWVAGLAAAAVTVALAPGLEAVERVALGFCAGEVIALIALVAGAVSVGDGAKARNGAAYLIAKRTLDIAVALILLVLTLPVVAAAALAVRLEGPGPIFFRQVRLGRDLKPFGILKMRSMEASADEAVFAEHLARLEAARHDETGPKIRIPDDHRVTRVGRLLRHWSIDELPNLWNVLEGSMTLVGPRPLVEAEAELVGLQSRRFTVKPGITGLAQVAGRDDLTLAERTALDEQYVDQQSLGRDLSILARTLGAVLTTRGE